MKFQVTFKNVGREKKTWTTELPSLADYVLRRELRMQKALASRLVDFHWAPGGASAAIIVGSLRHVGDLSVEGGVKVL